MRVVIASGKLLFADRTLANLMQVSMVANYKAVSLITVLLFSMVRPAAAEIVSDGTVDVAFDAGGFSNGVVSYSRRQEDGKVIIAGEFARFHGTTRQNLVRLNTDGTLDQSFVPWEGAGGYIFGLELLAGNKLLIWGQLLGSDPFATAYPYQAPKLVRLNSDGSADGTFRPGERIANSIGDWEGVATDPGWVWNALVQADGKVVVVGEFSYVYTGPGTYVARSCIARFNPDGSLDEDFDPGSGAALNGGSPQILNVVRQRHGGNAEKLVLFGNFDSFNGNPADQFVRLNGDGSVDQSFSVTSSTTPYADGLLVMPDDRLIVFGYPIANAPPIVLLQPDGASDPAFEPPPNWKKYRNSATLYDVALQADGKILASGTFHSVDGVPAHNVVRLNADGTRDQNFDVSVAAGPHCKGVRTLLVRNEDNGILIGGDFASYNGATRNGLAWTNSDGSLAPTFAGLSGASDRAPVVRSIVPQPDGKVIVAGDFSSVAGSPHYSIVRLDKDLSLDPNFNPDAGTNGAIYTVFLQADGKIMIGGSMNEVNGVARGCVARLNADGMLDSSFDPGAGPGNPIFALTEDQAGNVYVGGSFTTFDGQPRNRVAKLNPSGVLDLAFDPGIGPDGSVTGIAAAPEAQAVVIAGSFEQYNGTQVGHIARLNANTAVRDPSFNAGGTGFVNPIYSFLRAPDGKYYVGGGGWYNYSLPKTLTRLNNDGSVDESYGNNSGFLSSRALALQNDRVYISTFHSAPGVTRLISSGAFDNSFRPGSGASVTPAHYFSSAGPSVTTIAIDKDGKPLVGGSFTSYNGAERVCLVRLTDASNNPDLADPDGDGLSNLLEYAFHLDPQQPSAANRPYSVFDATYLSLIYTKTIAATDLAYTIEKSLDLKSWSTVAPINVVLADDGTTQTMKAQVPIMDAQRLFLRLRVSR